MVQAELAEIEREKKDTAPSCARVVVVTGREELAKYRDEWEKLAANAVVTNVFYEPWVLLPAMDIFPDLDDVIVVLIYERDDSSRSVLAGLFPLTIRKAPLGLPIALVSTLIHKYCYFSMPLIHRDYLDRVLKQFFDWMRQNPYHGRLLDMRLVPGDGKFQSSLAFLLTSEKLLSIVVRSFPRAIFRRSVDAETYLAQCCKSHTRRDIRRKEKFLRAAGEVEFVSATTEAEMERWTDDFLRMEALGWKGRAKVSFTYDRKGTEYFKALVRNGFARGSALLSWLQIDGKPIAMQGSFFAGKGGFGFVITYDEEFSKYSPGVLLLMEETRRLHAPGGAEWLDSCAHCDHPLFDRIWHDRRMLQRIIVSDGSAIGDVLVAITPALQWVRGILRPRK